MLGMGMVNSGDYTLITRYCLCFFVTETLVGKAGTMNASKSRVYVVVILQSTWCRSGV